MARIFTRTGDKGTTGIWAGDRLDKDHPLIEANGAIDECNAFVGLARSQITDRKLNEILRQIQGTLIIAGSDLTNVKRDSALPEVDHAHIEQLEKTIIEIDDLNPTLKNFILPAGGRSSSMLHCARTVSRKVERRLALLNKEIPVNKHLLCYFNRLSDCFFVLARYVLHLEGGEEEIWVNPRG